MIVHHDKPVGVDCFFREIFPGDTVRDADDKEYTIDERGWARPLDGSSGCGFKKLKDPAFVRKGETPDTRFREDTSGKVGPAVKVEVFGPTGDVPSKEEIAAKEPAPAPGPDLIEGYAPRRGGRVNNSGFSQVCNIAGRYGFRTKEARDLCVANGIEVFTHGSQKKAHIRVEDLQRFKDLLLRASGRTPDPGNYGAHRPNESGYTSFVNLARSLKVPAWMLRNFAKDHGIAIVRPGNGTRNDGVRLQEEGRFRELWAAEHGQPDPTTQDDDIVREVEERALWLRCLNECEGFTDTLLHNVLVARGFYTPIPAEGPAAPIPQDDLHRPILGTSDNKKVWTKFDAFLILVDQDLANELRRRGYEVTATKRIEL